MPLDHRSALPTVPGIPAWGAVAVAAGLSFLGFAFDAVSGDELTSTFSTLYFLGCVLAVLAVRQRGLFTAIVQPPLLLFVAVPICQQLLTDGAGTGIKDLALNVAFPLVNRFPLMLAATVVVALIGGARIFLVQQRSSAPARARTRRPAARSARPTSRPARSADDPHRREPARSAEGAPTERVSAADNGVRGSGDRRAHRAQARDPRVTQGAPHDPAPAHAPSYSGSMRARQSAEIPAHPIPQVRYRDRRDPPS
ncbi:hypothetical protein ERC79_18345 [Rhodococcus sp. ABRD24]|nr:hypothetical protein ERC79_18345 [Rhodococcus sp. ABRD24]